MKKITEYIAVLASRMILSISLFFTWYFLLGSWSQKIGAIVGAIGAIALLLFLKSKERGKRM